jgi:hypothetical protein
MPVVTSNLAAQYLLREGSGATAHDSSGNGLDGTLQGSPSWDSQGLEFISSTDRVLLPNTVLANDDTSITDASVEVWFKASGIGGGFAVDFANDQFSLFGSTSRWEMDVYNSVDYVVAFTPSGTSPGDWQHVVAVYDFSSTQTLKIYVDNALIVTEPIVNGSSVRLASSAGSKYLGSNGSALAGVLGECRVYSKALSSTEVSQNYTASESSYLGSAAPVISSFTASPSTIPAGLPSTLSFSVTGATSLSIDHGVGTVTGSSVSVSPTSTTTYTLTATNSFGSSTATVTVTVSGAVPAITFTITPVTDAVGYSRTLAWTVTGADSVSLVEDGIQGYGSTSTSGVVLTKTHSDLGIGSTAFSDSLVVTPYYGQSEITYTLSATNSDGTQTASITVAYCQSLTSAKLLVLWEGSAPNPSDYGATLYTPYYDSVQFHGGVAGSPIAFATTKQWSEIDFFNIIIDYTTAWQTSFANPFYVGPQVLVGGGHVGSGAFLKVYDIVLRFTYNDGTVVDTRPTSFYNSGPAVSNCCQCLRRRRRFIRKL